MNRKLQSQRGKTYQLQDERKWDELIPEATELISLEEKPNDKAYAYFMRGNAYLNKDQYEHAFEDSTRALELSPNLKYLRFHGAVYSRKGIRSAFQGEYETAFNYFKKALEYFPLVKSYNPFAYIASQILAIENLEKSQQNQAFEVYGKLWREVSQIQEKLFCKEESEVAHYTSLNALKNLSETESYFRLYNADYMNDPEEGQVFFKIMNKYKKSSEKESIEKIFYQPDDKFYRSPAYIGSFVFLE